MTMTTVSASSSPPPSSSSMVAAVPVVVKFAQFRSSPDPPFWLSVGSSKLDVLRLSEDPVRLYGHFGPSPPPPPPPPPVSVNAAVSAVNAVAIAPAVRFDPSSYRCVHHPPPPSSSTSSTSITTTTPSSSSPVVTTVASSPASSVRRNELIRFRGSLVCLNTLESLKRLDKNAHLDEECLPDLLRACGVLPPERRKQGGGEGEDEEEEEEEQEVQGEDGEEEDPCAALAATACVAHCDLKSNVTVYWFAFPCLVPRPGKAVSYSPPGGGGSEGGRRRRLQQRRVVDEWGTAGCRRLAKAFEQFRWKREEEETERRRRRRRRRGGGDDDDDGDGAWCPPYFVLILPSPPGRTTGMRCLPLGGWRGQHIIMSLSAEERKSRLALCFVDPNVAPPPSEGGGGRSRRSSRGDGR